MAGGVNDVNAMFVLVEGVCQNRGPESGDGGGNNGDAPFTLLVHPVHDGAAFVDIADLVGLTGVEKNPFGGGGLAGVDMGNDTNVPDSV